MSIGASSFGRATGTQAIIEFLNRNGAPAYIGSLAQRTPADAWNAFLNYQNGSDGASGIRGQERLWLQGAILSVTSSPAPKGSTLSDLWNIYLAAKGHTGSIDDKFAQWLDHGTLP
jgi:hypothetical protein